MFAIDLDKTKETLMNGAELLVEFATLGEYGVHPCEEAPPKKRVRRPWCYESNAETYMEVRPKASSAGANGRPTA